jgi:3-oxoacyl-(acyl-carrier-protein) synthase
MTQRVVITGLGVIAPNANGVRDFELALRKGRSGLRADTAMEEAGFGCRVAGFPRASTPWPSRTSSPTCCWP